MVESSELPLERIDPAQPPLESVWADAWLRLARVRHAANNSDVAIAAAQVARRLDPSLADDAQVVIDEATRQREVTNFSFVQVGDVGALVLERWVDSVQDAGALYTGGIVCGAGICFAHLVTSVMNLAGRRILELGSGTGVAGLAAALCGADVLLTDMCDALPLLEGNIGRNSAAIRQGGGCAVARSLDYRDFSIVSDLLNFDLVLGTDLIWKKEQCEQLAQWCSAVGLPLLMIHVCRWPWVSPHISQAYEAVGLEKHDIPNLQSAVDDWASKHIKFASYDELVVHFFSHETPPPWLCGKSAIDSALTSQPTR